MKSYSKELLEKYPGISDLESKARRRIPDVSWAYLQTGTGEEVALDRNRKALDDILLNPRFFKGELKPNFKTTLFGIEYNLPFGIAPVGLSGLIWPGAEMILAKTAYEYRIPYCLSTVATQTPETIGPLSQDMSWFQLYAPRKKEIREDILLRAKKSGFKTLVLTADVPQPSRRERTIRAGLKTPPKLTAKFLWDGITCPSWTSQVLRHGLPKLKTVWQYAESKDAAKIYKDFRTQFGGSISWQYLKEVRDIWDGHLIIKGITHPDDALEAVSIGVDGIIVSNHGGRQFDAVPGAINLLPPIVSAVGNKTTVMFDSGIRSGLDVLRAYHLGAKFVFLGRGFLTGVAALGEVGAAHVCEILKEDIHTNMMQLGIKELGELVGLE